MQLNVSTDYAVRVVMLLSSEKRTFSSAELSQKLHIPQNYLMKILKQLRDGGLVLSERGISGGYSLAPGCGDVTFAQILDVMNDSVRINRCEESDCTCIRTPKGDCPVRAFYDQIQGMLDHAFATTSVASLLPGGRGHHDG